MIEGVHVQLDCPGLIPGSAASLTNCFVSLCLTLLICKMERILPTHMVIASIRCMIPSKIFERVCGIKVSSMLAIMMMRMTMTIVWGGDSLVTFQHDEGAHSYT